MEFMEPSEPGGPILGWVERDGVSPVAAIEIAADYLDRDPDTLQARGVLMRVQSDVEAAITPMNEDGIPAYVECTKRARHPEPFWRIEAIVEGER